MIDTKLARETKGNTVLQLCLYSDLLADKQKLTPEFAHVVTPGSGFKPQSFRFHDYAAYYRLVRNSLERAVKDGTGAQLYPEPKPHCEICRWRMRCDARRREDDHPTLVAGILKSQVAELGRHGVTTLAALAALPLPLPWKPERGAVQSFERIREQARLQLQGRIAGKPPRERNRRQMKDNYRQHCDGAQPIYCGKISVSMMSSRWKHIRIVEFWVPGKPYTYPSLRSSFLGELASQKVLPEDGVST